MSDENKVLEEVTTSEYKYGFYTDIENDAIPPGLNEDVVRIISAKKEEPEWMLEWRLNAFRKWSKMKEPNWQKVNYERPDYQAITYYSAPKKKEGPDSLDEVDPELLKTFERLGISLEEQKRLTGVAVDVVVDSSSVATSFKEKLGELGIIFCSTLFPSLSRNSGKNRCIGAVVIHLKYCLGIL